MKGLSVRQPWAHMIVRGSKRIENRTWGTEYRGEIAIHASKGCSRQEHADAVEFVTGSSLGAIIPRRGSMPLGAIVGVVTIIDCLEPWRTVDAVEIAFRASLGRPALPDLSWWDHAQYGWVLDEVRPLVHPITCSGALRLWQLPIAVEQAIAKQLNSHKPNS